MRSTCNWVTRLLLVCLCLWPGESTPREPRGDDGNVGLSTKQKFNLLRPFLRPIRFRKLDRPLLPGEPHELEEPDQFALPPPSNATVRALGYLDCNDYSGVSSTSSTVDSTNGLNSCIRDAYINQLTAFLSDCDGTYLITDTLTAYEWVAWAGSGPAGAPSNNNVIRGSTACLENVPPTRPTIKIKDSATLFNNASSPRPMVVSRTFAPLNSNAVPDDPSHPLVFVTEMPGDPPNYREQGSVGFTEVFEGIDLDTNGKVGAIGITMQSAQGCLLANSKITATGSIAGIYNPPGRNSPSVNIEVIGGTYCVLSGAYSAPLPNLPNTQGIGLFGLTCTGQTSSLGAIRVNDGVPPVIAGFNITKSANGPAIAMDAMAAVLKDGRISMSGAAANDIIINNPTGFTLYVNNVFTTGSNQLIKSGGNPVYPAPSGTWTQIAEYVYTDQFNRDSSTDHATFPATPSGIGRFEARSVIEGQLGDAPIPTSHVVSSSGPPSDLLTRHSWERLPSFEDGPYVNPDDYGDCAANLGYDLRTVVTEPEDCTAEINQAITDAASAGHNRVVIPQGTFLVSRTDNTPAVQLAANTKLIGAGPHKSAIAYKSTWNPTAAVPLIQTTNSATDAPYIGLFTLYIKTAPLNNDWMYYLRWRAGKNSLSVMIDYNSQFKCKCSGTCTETDQPRKALWFSNNGGGRHYVNQFNLVSDFDRNSASRAFFFDGTSQPLVIYGFNAEGGKGFGCGAPTTNNEALNASNIRTYGSKHEGDRSVLLVNNSDNVAGYGIGALSLPPNTASPFLRVTGTSSGVLFAPAIVRDTAAAGSATQYMLSETITNEPVLNTIPWATGISIYKRGTLDDAPFTTSGTPPPASPVVDATRITVSVADRVDVCWTIFDGAPMSPASASTGWTVTVDGATKAVQSSVRAGLDCYQLTFASGTITTGTQPVVVSYAAGGNITAGGPGTPAATAFSGLTANNTLTPVPSPVYTQAAYGFRSVYGLTDTASSPWYESTAGTFESVPLRAKAGGMFRVRVKIGVTTGDAPAQSFQIYYNENEGAYNLLTTSSAGLAFADAPELSDGLPLLTQQLTPVQSTFVPCGFVESATGQVIVTLPAGSETECEVGLKLQSDAPLGNRYRLQFRRVGGAAFESYPEAGVPLITVVSPRAIHAGGSRR